MHNQTVRFLTTNDSTFAFKTFKLMARQVFFATLLLLSVIKSAFAQHSVFSFAVLGDMPYDLPADYTVFDSLISKVNASNMAFSIHVGDFKSSVTPCSNKAFDTIRNYFSKFENPLIYTPGDNEWTDCHKPEAGGYIPTERLLYLRKLFFSTPYSLGMKPVQLFNQGMSKKNTAFVENTYFSFKRVSFATLHVVGSNNNFFVDTEDHCKEFYERQLADLDWLEIVFSKAKADSSLALVIAMQADMYKFSTQQEKPESGFILIKKKLAELSYESNLRILLVNGDTHEFVIDKPILINNKCLENFSRVTVPGDKNHSYVKINVDSKSPTVFSFEEVAISTTAPK